jgi:hypothetical protein
LLCGEAGRGQRDKTGKERENLRCVLCVRERERERESERERERERERGLCVYVLRDAVDCC